MKYKTFGAAYFLVSIYIQIILWNIPEKKRDLLFLLDLVRNEPMEDLFSGVQKIRLL